MEMDLNTVISILTGSRVVLRPPQLCDMEDRRQAGINPEFRTMVGAPNTSDRSISQAKVEQWYQNINEEPYTWIIEVEGRCIGSARLHAVDTHNRRARYAVGIFNASYWNRGLGTEATRLVLHYAFTDLGLHRVDLRVLAYNQRAIRCYEKVGFVIEGCEREGVWLNGEWETDVWMSILEHEFLHNR